MTASTYSGEAQFAGYSDSSRSGPRITFRLADREDLQKFVGVEGKRYMLAIVEIADDETPAEPQPEKPKGGEQARTRFGPLHEWAVIRCKDSKFQAWLKPHYDRVMGGDGSAWGDVSPERDFGGSVEKWARHAVLVISETDSRKNLDTNSYSKRLFETLIRRPYMQYAGVTA